jgi:hypothetical protein
MAAGDRKAPNKPAIMSITTATGRSILRAIDLSLPSNELTWDHDPGDRESGRVWISFYFTPMRKSRLGFAPLIATKHRLLHYFERMQTILPSSYGQMPRFGC